MATGDKRPVVMSADRAVANGIATLGADAKLSDSQIPIQKIMAVTNAAEYSQTQTYVLGAYCTRDGKLYRCTTAITTAETWTADHWTETTMGAELVDIYTALARKAPSGYGIGEEYATLVRDTDLDTLKKGGTYYIGTGCTNIPPNTDSSWSTLHVIPGRACTQIFIPANDASRAGTFSSWIARIYNDKTAAWGEWEWVNPPMAAGVEYRTTERYQVKPVYAQLVNFGYGPNNTNAHVTKTIENIGDIVRWSGVMSDGCPFPFDNHMYSPAHVVNGIVYKTTNTLHIDLYTNENKSTTTMFIYVFYTKTTD